MRLQAGRAGSARVGGAKVSPDAHLQVVSMPSNSTPDPPKRWLQDVSEIAVDRLLAAEDPTCRRAGPQGFRYAQPVAMKIGRDKKVICYLNAAAGDWGGASRVLFTEHPHYRP